MYNIFELFPLSEQMKIDEVVNQLTKKAGEQYQFAVLNEDMQNIIIEVRI